MPATTRSFGKQRERNAMALFDIHLVERLERRRITSMDVVENDEPDAHKSRPLQLSKMTCLHFWTWLCRFKSLVNWRSEPLRLVQICSMTSVDSQKFTSLAKQSETYNNREPSRATRETANAEACGEFSTQ